MSDTQKSIVSLSYVPNYGKDPKWEKIKRKFKSTLLRKIDGTPLKFAIYPAYWHYKFSLTSKNSLQKSVNHFLAQKPNYGAGIGHQIANWNAGFYFSQYYNLKFAHYPFSTAKWDKFLGFGEGEIFAEELKKNKFKVVRIPRFDSTKEEEVELIKKVVASYKKPNILFCFEIDQGYMDQYHTALSMSKKFFNAPLRKEEKLIFKSNAFNIGIHIRRRMKIETDEAWKERGLDNDYFSKILQQVLANINTNKKVEIYLFSQGKIEDFPEFKMFEGIHYCMDMGPVESFLHMVYADVLISSKSSFSYKPALISKGIKICPSSFWHGYPATNDFIMANNDSSFDTTRLSDVNNILSLNAHKAFKQI